MKEKTTEAQKRASRNWEEKNRSKATVDSYRRTTRLFIRSHAAEEDLREIEQLIAERRYNK